MSPRMDKAAIHHACMVKQQHLIADFEKEIASLKKEMFTHDVSQSQGDSGAVERNELLVRYENELIFLNNELHTLESIDPSKETEKVELGSVVVTDLRIFYVSVSIEQIVVDGHEIFGLSVNAPIYEAMSQAAKGDVITFNGTDYKILDVY
jgi:transcription elongation GreA/GreB family factor